MADEDKGKREACWQYMDDFANCNRWFVQAQNYYVSGGELLDCGKKFRVLSACLNEQNPLIKKEDKTGPTLAEAKLEHPVWQLMPAAEAAERWRADCAESPRPEGTPVLLQPAGDTPTQERA